MFEPRDPLYITFNDMPLNFENYRIEFVPKPPPLLDALRKKVGQAGIDKLEQYFDLTDRHVVDLFTIIGHDFQDINLVILEAVAFLLGGTELAQRLYVIMKEEFEHDK